MSRLIALQGPEAGRTYSLRPEATILGRQHDSAICLLGRAISRHHARIIRQNGAWVIEDLDSSNGTFLNGQRLAANTPMPLTERDTLQIGPYVFGLRQPTAPPPAAEPNMVVRETVSAVTLHQSLLGTDPAAKLQVVLDISHHLARALEIDELLDKLLEKVMQLFPQADRALAILCEGAEVVLRAQRARRADAEEATFSRTVVRRALKDGIGLISDDVNQDERFTSSQTLHGLGMRSMMCVPMIDADGRRLGVLQIDRHGRGFGFNVADLQLLTAVALQVAVVLENAALHAERLRQERLHQELALARDIQQGYLPDELEDFPSPSFEVFGRVYPARQVAGDYYDYLKAPCGKLAFFIGDVSGKGMPAALFLGAVRTLARHLTREGRGPVQTLTAINRDLADDNPTCMFVTLAHGLYDPATAEAILSSAGHYPPLWRRADGTITPVPLRSGRLLGYDEPDLHLSELRLKLSVGDLLVFFTDGVLEARSPDLGEQFGLERLPSAVREITKAIPLSMARDRIKQRMTRFTGTQELRDDATLLLLRRNV